MINGGIINAYGTNARLGAGDWMVVEADESDGTFLRLPAVIAVVTNIDPEHLDHYGTFEAMNAAYEDFVDNIPFYGFAVLCIDHPEVQAMIPRLSDRRIVTYGFIPQADVRAIDLRLDPDGAHFDVAINDRFARDRAAGSTTCTCRWSAQHNVQNALAAIAVAREMGIDEDVIRSGFAGFDGVKRRFTRTGEADGVTVIDDYGHHPVEIAAVLKAARARRPRASVIAVVQPHRYTRLAQPVRGILHLLQRRRRGARRRRLCRRRAPIEGVEPRRAGRGPARARPSPRRALSRTRRSWPRWWRRSAAPGDLVVCLGAGSITDWAQALPAELQAIYGQSQEQGRMMSGHGSMLNHA